MAVIAVLLAAVLFGTTGTAQALAVDALGAGATTPSGVGAVRLLVGGAGLLLLLPVLGRPLAGALRLWRTGSGLLAGAATAAYQVCFFAAVSQVGVGVGTLVTIGSGPVAAGLLSWVLLGERPTRAWMSATAVCLAGLVLLSADGLGTGSGGSGLTGVALALAAGFSYAVYTVLARRLITAGSDSSTVMASAFGLGGLLLLPILVTQPMAWLGTPSGLALAAYLGLATTTVAYLLFGFGLRHLAAGPVTTLVLAEPLVATTLGIVVLDEPVSVPLVVGAALVGCGLVLQAISATRSPGRGRPAEPTPVVPGLGG